MEPEAFFIGVPRLLLWLEEHKHCLIVILSAVLYFLVSGSSILPLMQPMNWI